MSSWKKAAKVNQKTHRERHQPQERASLGLLEKKKDYVKRARDFNQKKFIIKKLKNIALNRNPDEFYFHMVNSRLKDGQHVENKKVVDEHTVEQAKLMQHRNYNYVSMKRTIESKKIDKIQSELHLTEVAENFPRQHIRFDDEAGPSHSSDSDMPVLSNVNLTNLSNSQLNMLRVKRQKSYKDLVKRINRENQLHLVQRKMEIASALDNHKGLPVKCVKQGSKTEAPVFLWKYERKR